MGWRRASDGPGAIFTSVPTGLDVGDLTSIAERAETSGVSYFAQIPDGKRRRRIIIDTPSQGVRSSIQAESGERADTAVVSALTPICVEKFLQNTDAKANLAVLQKISSSWEQGDYLQKGGWVTQPGATSSDYHLARACAEKLVQLKAPGQ